MKTIIVNAHVISPGVDLAKATVVVEGDRIARVSAKPVAAKKGDAVVDAMVAGFWAVGRHHRVDLV